MSRILRKTSVCIELRGMSGGLSGGGSGISVLLLWDPEGYPPGCSVRGRFCSSYFSTTSVSVAMYWFARCSISGTIVGDRSISDQKYREGRVPLGMLGSPVKGGRVIGVFPAEASTEGLAARIRRADCTIGLTFIVRSGMVGRCDWTSSVQTAWTRLRSSVVKPTSKMQATDDVGQPTPEKEDEEVFLRALQFSCSAVFPMVLKVAIDLQLLEIIVTAGPEKVMSPEEIAARLPTQNPLAPIWVDRILRLLSTNSIVGCTIESGADGRPSRKYTMTPISKFFTKNHDRAVVNMFLLHHDKVFMDLW
ncbi:hypothetical protein B296_00031327 [Ensete ventricosum]|uniref:O-methyltransferase dimerisation domain-containing protein n=1 Tax=Ensete ventricosum TaxID=4639 RepID=A0A426ZEA5_ENSVE|nr:hypothetical protein B296_00031327 [Ensete ventricosum]